MVRFLTTFWRKQPEHVATISYVRKHFGFTPCDPGLYKQALRHSSAIKRGAKGSAGSNERLEFLGDTVLDVIVAEYLYTSFEDLSEGELTKMKAKIVSRRTLNQIGDRLDIGKQIEARLGKQPMHRSMIGNALEALIGAMYLDKGYKFTAQKMLKLLEEYDIHERVHDVTDFKSKLHEWCQKHKKTLSFEVIRENPSSNSIDRYEIVAYVDGEAYGRGKGKSKKGAEQQAAQQVCANLVKD